MYINKNLDRGFKDLSIFEIGPIFTGYNPGQQSTVICGLSAGKKYRSSWIDKERNVDVFDVKRDVVQTLVEAGYNYDKFVIDDETAVDTKTSAGCWKCRSTLLVSAKWYQIYCY